jgi:hypothetical protein
LDLEKEIGTLKIDDFVDASTAEKRAKTSLRLKYEAEIAVLKKEIGTLEDVRIRLGFSRRKICQTLMVDPSAWTRWTADKGDAPPHIYQALKWYLDSKTHQSKRFEGYWEELKDENHNLQTQLSNLQIQMKKIKTFSFYVLLIGITWALAIGIFLWMSRYH